MSYKLLLIVALCAFSIAECQPAHEQTAATAGHVRVARQMPNPMSAMSAMASIPSEMGNAASQMAGSAMKAFSNVAGGMMGGMPGMGMGGGMGGGMPQMPGSQGMPKIPGMPGR